MDFEQIESGKTVEGKIIEAFKFEPQKGQKFLYLMAGVHGDEPEGVHVLNQIRSLLEKDQSINYNIVLIPELNRDGLAINSRVNANGVDLNRNYPSSGWTPEHSEPKYNPGPKPLSEPENKFLEKTLKKYPPSLIISLHSYKPMLNFNGDCKWAADYIAQFTGYDVVGEFEYPTPGSFGEWVPETFNAGVLTYECPMLSLRESMDQIWEENREGLISFLTNSYNK